MSVRKKWGWWAFGAAWALVAVVVAWWVVAGNLPLNQGAMREKLTAGGFAFEPDEQSVNRFDFLQGDAWGAPVDGVTYYFELSVSGRGNRFDHITCRVYLKPKSKRRLNSTNEPLVVFERSNGSGTNVYKPSATATEFPAMKDAALLQFEKLVNALR
jgi:hypothetical protein